ncbi:MAG: S41 family peptidase [Chlorobiaceae bacterium]|nr:S41 family peptidase [Chlorobiaceae bacterium]
MPMGNNPCKTVNSPGKVRFLRRAQGWIAAVVFYCGIHASPLYAISSPGKEYFDIVKSIDLVGEVYREISQGYVDKVNVSELMYAGIDGMLHTLDQYTVFLDEDASKDFGEQTSGQYPGVGISIAGLEENVFVTSIVDGYPASKAGIRVGDRIDSINNTKLKSLPLEKVRELIKGPVGSSLLVRIDRKGSPSFIAKLVREEIRLNSVTYFGLIDGIGYIEMKNFGTHSAEDLREAYEGLKREAADRHIILKGLVLDLRHNPGGLLTVAVDVTSLFVKKGSEVVSIKGRTPDTYKSYTTANPPLDTVLPLAILINSETASAAEIVSGAIQDLDRGVLIGERSFGKGLVQSILRISYDHILKMTTSKYYTPSGRLIQKESEAGSESRKVLTRTAGENASKVFYTKGKRKVYGGGGITPDIEMNESASSPYLSELRKKGMIFLFSSDMRSANAVMPAQPFDRKALMTSFNDFLSTRKFVYKTEPEQRLTDLRESIERLQKGKDKAELKSLDGVQQEIGHLREMELARESDKITDALEVEILRHYNEHDARRVELGHDPVFTKAVEILSDRKKYSSLLHL